MPTGRHARRQMQVVADPHIERALVGNLRLLSQLLAGGQVVVYRLAEGGLQFGYRVAFVVDQCADEEQLAEQAVVLGAGFDGAVIAPVLQQTVHGISPPVLRCSMIWRRT